MRHQQAILALTRERVALKREIVNTIKELDALNGLRADVASTEQGQDHPMLSDDYVRLVEGYGNRRDLMIAADKDLLDSMNALASKSIDDQRLACQIAALKALVTGMAKAGVFAAMDFAGGQLLDLVDQIDLLQRRISDAR